MQSLAMACVFVYLATVYVRPGEVVPAWRGLPITLYVGVVCAAVCALVALVRQRRIFGSPSDRYAYAFFLAAALSTVLNGWIGGMSLVAERLGPSLLAYFVIRVAIDSHARLQRLRWLIMSLTLFLVGNGLLQHFTGVGLGEVQALTVRDFPGAEDHDDPATEVRIRGTGIFNDPNDLAFAVVLAVPLVLGVAMNRSSTVAARLLTTALAIPTVATILLTRSRGGLLGLLVGMLGLMWLGGRRKVAIAVLGLALAAFGASASGRLSNVTASEQSAQGRIESWSAGLTMVKASPLWGVGFGAYTDHHELAAHNSFVHVLAELGLVGAFCFAGLAVSYLYATVGGGSENATSVPWAAAGIASFICASFLSRQYSVPLFILFAVAGCLHEIAGGRVKAASPAVVAAALLGGVIAVYLAVLALGDW